jgi:hypothetical protein
MDKFHVSDDEWLAEGGMLTLMQLRTKIPFLKLIPDAIYFNLDPAEFLLPNQEISEARRYVESELGHYVMTYNRNVFLAHIPAEFHLCGHLKGADLTAEQCVFLYSCEERFKDASVSFVVYKNPLEIISVQESAIFKYQQSQNRLQSMRQEITKATLEPMFTMVSEIA